MIIDGKREAETVKNEIKKINLNFKLIIIRITK